MFFREALEFGGALIAMDAGDGLVIWSSRFNGYRAERSEVEIGWTFLARSRWGGLYNGEMKRLMLRHAFQFVNRVSSDWSTESAFTESYRKIGAVRVGSGLDPGGRNSFIDEITAATFFQREQQSLRT